MAGTIIKAEHLTRTLTGDVPATLVADASLSVETGALTAIVGPSGSGKSSLLYLLGLLDRPTSGRLWVDGIETGNLDDNARARLRRERLGFVFQFHFLLPEFTALENVLLPVRRLRGRIGQQETERASDLLARLGLGDHLHKLPRQLSGGQAQRVAIARALANGPKVVLADEPTGNLDTASSQTVQGILHDMARVDGRAVIIVTHDPAFAANADRQVRIVDGRIQGEGSGLGD